jgi:hypothetical protein
MLMNEHSSLHDRSIDIKGFKIVLLTNVPDVMKIYNRNLLIFEISLSVGRKLAYPVYLNLCVYRQETTL